MIPKILIKFYILNILGSTLIRKHHGKFKQQTKKLIKLLLINFLNRSLVFLLGGGFALAAGGKKSGMSAMLGQSLTVFQEFPFLLLLFLICLVCQILTEFTSNVAIANVILPVLGEMAIAIGKNPMLLMYPAALSCCFAFHMPVGTPPNAIVAGVGNIRTKHMAVAGIGPSLITLFVVWATFPT